MECQADLMGKNQQLERNTRSSHREVNAFHTSHHGMLFSMLTVTVLVLDPVAYYNGYLTELPITASLV
jgi:hypothetical protein